MMVGNECWACVRNVMSVHKSLALWAGKGWTRRESLHIIHQQKKQLSTGFIPQSCSMWHLHKVISFVLSKPGIKKKCILVFSNKTQLCKLFVIFHVWVNKCSLELARFFILGLKQDVQDSESDMCKRHRGSIKENKYSLLMFNEHCSSSPNRTVAIPNDGNNLTQQGGISRK